MSQSSNCRLSSVGPFFFHVYAVKTSVVVEALALSYDAVRLRVSLCEIGLQHIVLWSADESVKHVGHRLKPSKFFPFILLRMEEVILFEKHFFSGNTSKSISLSGSSNATDSSFKWHDVFYLWLPICVNLLTNAWNEETFQRVAFQALVRLWGCSIIQVQWNIASLGNCAVQPIKPRECLAWFLSEWRGGRIVTKSKEWTELISLAPSLAGQKRRYIN